MFGAAGTGIAMVLVTQFVLPPAFLHFYGVIKYGEWLVLSSALNYLSTLNFGITTYASNELTMLRKRGKMDQYRELQGSTLALLFCMLGVGSAIASIFFLLPISHLLHLSAISPADAQWTAFLLGIQAMVNILASYYTGLFMVVEKTHRGIYWNYLRYLSGTIISVPMAMLRVQFSILALAQLAAIFIVTILTIWDLRRRMGGLPLGLREANWKTAKASLAPSGMFAMIFTQQFLIFQAPVIMLQWILGPAVVVLFTISRTILSAARTILTAISSSIAPEITFSYANRDMKKLLNIFHYSEKVVFAGIPVTNLGAFLFSPILLQIWLHKPGLFDPYIYGLMALISAAMSMREHKQFFQFSTNTHKQLSLIVFFGNLLMIAVSIPVTQKFGIYGFMATWLASEVAQMVLLYHENKKLFRNDPSINFVPVLILVSVMLVSLPLCILGVEYARQHSLLAVCVVAIVGTMILGAQSYLVFRLKDVSRQFLLKMRDTPQREYKPL